MNKYKVRVWLNGGIHRTLNDIFHCNNGPAVQWICGWKDWYTNGVWIKADKGQGRDGK